MEEMMDLIKKLFEKVKTVNSFCYACTWDRPNISSGCEAAVKARLTICWVRLSKCGTLPLENRFPLKRKD